MKKFLISLLVGLLTLSGFAKDDSTKITTVKMNIPAKIVMQEDSTFTVESTDPNLYYTIEQDTILKIGSMNRWEDKKNIKILIKTPKRLNVKTSRYLKINN